MQTLQNLLIGGFTIQRRLHRGHGVVAIHIAPVVLPEVGFSVQPIVVPRAQRNLIIAAMPGLEHIEIQPRFIVEPKGRRSAPEWMVAHQFVRIQLLEQASLPAVQIMLLVAANIAAQQPNDIRTRAVPIRQKGHIAVDILLANVPLLHHMSPCGKQRHIQSQLFGNVHHSLHKAPVSGICRILFDLSGIGGGHFRQAVNQHRLNHIEPLTHSFPCFHVLMYFIPESPPSASNPPAQWKPSPRARRTVNDAWPP